MILITIALMLILERMLGLTRFASG
jgi:hypothetical protein